MGLDCPEKDLLQIKLTLRTAFNVPLKRVILLYFITFLCSHTLRMFIFIFHIFLTKIRFHSNENRRAVSWSICNKFIAPLVKGGLKTLTVNKTEAYKKAVCGRINESSNSFKFPLAESIIYAKRNFFVLKVNIAFVSTNYRGCIAFRKLIRCVANHHGCFTDSAITDNNNFYFISSTFRLHF